MWQTVYYGFVVLTILIILAIAKFGGKALDLIVPWLANSLAEGKFFNRRNLYFTVVKEAQCKAIMESGQFNRFILAYEGYGIDQHWNIRRTSQDGQVTEENDLHWDEKERRFVKYKIAIRPIEKGGNYTYSSKIDEEGKPIGENTIEIPGRLPKKMPEWIKKRLPGSIWWIGNPFIYSIHTYNFQWATLRQKEVNGELTDTIHYEDWSESNENTGPIDYILLATDIYAAILKGPETSDLLSTDILLLLTGRIVNPYKSLFRVEQWLEAAVNQVKVATRDWIAHKSYKNAIQKTEKEKREKDPILRARNEKGIGNYIERHWGFRIQNLGFKNITPDDRFVNLTLLPYKAEQEKAAEITAAEGRATAFTTFAKSIGKEDDGLSILAAQTMEKVSQGTATTIVEAPSLSKFLGNMAGDKVSAKDLETMLRSLKPSEQSEKGDQS